jgi:hypothetical protein
MSVSEFARTEQVTRTALERIESLQALLTALVGVVVQSVQAVAFWAATLLPLSYLPLLTTDVAAKRPIGFAALLCLNAVAFVVGHAYKRDEAEER